MKVVQKTLSRWPRNDINSRPVATSQVPRKLRPAPLLDRKSRPPPAAAIRLPSGLTAMACTCDRNCPIVVSGLPSSVAHVRIVLSSPPLTNQSPPGLNATHWTPAVCPFKARRSRPARTSQSRML